jgi:hypothetical protein
MFPSIGFSGAAQRTCNLGVEYWAKEELFSSIAHILIVVEFEDACVLWICDGGMSPKVV